jgi:hypothetical protein
MPPLTEAATTAVRRLMHEPSESHAFLLRRTWISQDQPYSGTRELSPKKMVSGKQKVAVGE